MERTTSECERLDISVRHSRRSILNVLALTSAGCLTSFCTCIQVGQAATGENATMDIESSTPSKEQINRKPYAPLENLLPATRVKVLIDQAVETTFTLTLILGQNQRYQ